jgi:tetratricopeptide (TPR) repeat protein
MDRIGTSKATLPKAMAFGILACFMLGACSTMKVPVPVMRPAEINLKGKNEIIIGQINGRGGEKIAAYVKEKTADSGRLKIVDRQHLNRVLRELRMSQSDLVNLEKRKKLGKLMAGSILVMGNVLDNRYKENLTHDRGTCYKTVNKKQREYTCYHYKRKGTATVKVSFDVIDIETGENLRSKVSQCVQKAQKSATDKRPERIDGGALLDSCSQSVANDFLKAICPWQQIVSAAFQKDGDLPMLEIGINYAKSGLWTDALSQFKEAVKQADSNADLSPKTAAKAYWDLGLCCEYTNRFDESVGYVKKAYALSSDAEYLKELANIEKMKKDRERLEEQMSYNN